MISMIFNDKSNGTIIKGMKFAGESLKDNEILPETFDLI